MMSKTDSKAVQSSAEVDSSSESPTEERVQAQELAGESGEGQAEAVPAESHLVPGTHVSHYRIGEVLGRGGMGIVYRAVDLNLNRDVAIKYIRPDRADSSDLRNRIMREGHLASRLAHPNIVRVLDVFEVEGLPAIVMELVEGTSLRTRLEAQEPLPIEEVLSHSEDLARALIAAHSRSILHRDVNPNNVLISSHGHALLTDFGLARPAAGRADESTRYSVQTETGIVIGTPGYLSPEQLLGREIDARSDIFSLGAVMYEMCTGKRAFPASSGVHHIDATLNLEPVPVTKLRQAVPPELERIIVKALAKRPEDRYQDARALAADIRALRRHSTTGIQAIRDRHLTRPPLRAVALVLGGILVAALAVFVVRTALQHSGQTEPLPDLVPRQLTGGSGLETEPAISPDGGFVAYASDESGDFQIWVADVVSGQTLRLTSDSWEDRTPAWFPDSSGIAFASRRGDSLSVWKTTRLGGQPVLLLPDAIDPAISPDGSKIAYARGGEKGGPLRIWVAPLEALGRERCIDSTAGFWEHRHPAWAPDGISICFSDWDGLWRVPASGGTPSRIGNALPLSRYPAWSPGGRYIYFASRKGESRALWRVPVSGGHPQRLTFGTGSESMPSLSHDGRRLAYSTSATTSQVGLLSIQTGERADLPSLRYPTLPIVSTDRSRLLVIASPSDQADIWSIPIERGRPSGPPKQVTTIGGVGTFSLSPDGRWIAFHRYIENRRDIFTCPAEGGAANPILDDPAAEVNPAFSPDGSKLAFSSDRDGNPDIWVIPIVDGKATGPARKLTNGPAPNCFPAWSLDGNTIAYVGDEDIWVVPSDGTHPPRRVTSGARARRVCWGPWEGELLVSGAWGTTQNEVRRVQLGNGETRRLTPPLILGSQDGFGDFSVSPDGTLIAFVVERTRGNVWLMETTNGHL